ncbi:hypothetical protein I4Z71_004464 [Salmonella enterica subsp. enterica serovar Grumpensis]|nr:hypothetical protein [Salmonella enterica subsp. enterica serovar Grumpensis]
MIKKQQSQRERGLTLIESAMVLALSAVVISGVMFYYNSTANNLALQNIENKMMSIAEKINALYVNQNKSGYAGLNTEIVSRFFPKGATTVNDKGLIFTGLPGVIQVRGSATPWNTDETGITGPYYIIQYWFASSASHNTRTDQCVALLANNINNPSVYSIEVNSDNSRYFKAGKVSISELSKTCSQPSVGGITIFYK